MEAILIDTEKLQELLSVSKKTAVKIGEAADARIQIGRAVRWKVSKIEEYLNTNKEIK